MEGEASGGGASPMQLWKPSIWSRQEVILVESSPSQDENVEELYQNVTSDQSDYVTADSSQGEDPNGKVCIDVPSDPLHRRHRRRRRCRLRGGGGGRHILPPAPVGGSGDRGSSDSGCFTGYDAPCPPAATTKSRRHSYAPSRLSLVNSKECGVMSLMSSGDTCLGASSSSIKSSAAGLPELVKRVPFQPPVPALRRCPKRRHSELILQETKKHKNRSAGRGLSCSTTALPEQYVPFTTDSLPPPSSASGGSSGETHAPAEEGKSRGNRLALCRKRDPPPPHVADIPSPTYRQLSLNVFTRRPRRRELPSVEAADHSSGTCTTELCPTVPSKRRKVARNDDNHGLDHNNSSSCNGSGAQWREAPRLQQVVGSCVTLAGAQRSPCRQGTERKTSVNVVSSESSRRSSRQLSELESPTVLVETAPDTTATSTDHSTSTSTTSSSTSPDSSSHVAIQPRQKLQTSEMIVNHQMPATESTLTSEDDECASVTHSSDSDSNSSSDDEGDAAAVLRTEEIAWVWAELLFENDKLQQELHDRIGGWLTFSSVWKLSISGPKCHIAVAEPGRYEYELKDHPGKTSAAAGVLQKQLREICINDGCLFGLTITVESDIPVYGKLSVSVSDSASRFIDELPTDSRAFPILIRNAHGAEVPRLGEPPGVRTLDPQFEWSSPLASREAGSSGSRCGAVCATSRTPGRVSCNLKVSIDSPVGRSPIEMGSTCNEYSSGTPQHKGLLSPFRKEKGILDSHMRKADALSERNRQVIVISDEDEKVRTAIETGDCYVRRNKRTDDGNASSSLRTSVDSSPASATSRREKKIVLKEGRRVLRHGDELLLPGVGRLRFHLAAPYEAASRETILRKTRSDNKQSLKWKGCQPDIEDLPQIEKDKIRHVEDSDVHTLALVGAVLKNSLKLRKARFAAVMPGDRWGFALDQADSELQGIVRQKLRRLFQSPLDSSWEAKKQIMYFCLRRTLETLEEDQATDLERIGSHKPNFASKHPDANGNRMLWFSRRKTRKDVTRFTHCVAPRVLATREMRGQLGLFSTEFIPKGTFLGPFVGVIYRSERYEALMSQGLPSEWYFCQRFSMDMNALNRDVDGGAEVHSQKSTHGRASQKSAADNQPTAAVASGPVGLVVDPCHHGNRLMVINDFCRNPFDRSARRDEDERDRINAHFDHVHLAGMDWPGVSTTCDIEADKEILLDYGEEYFVHNRLASADKTVAKLAAFLNGIR